MPDDANHRLENSDLISYLNYMLEQVKLQQEVRDRWFGYYLTIAGASGVGIGTAIQIFGSPAFYAFYERLWILLLGLTVALFLIGSCFFMLYLSQRSNYLDYYQKMRKIETKLPFSVDKKSFTPRSRGADFYTIQIHVIINSIYFGLMCFFVVVLATKSLDIDCRHIAAFVLAFLVATISFEVICQPYFPKTDREKSKDRPVDGPGDGT